MEAPLIIKHSFSFPFFPLFLFSPTFKSESNYNGIRTSISLEIRGVELQAGGDLHVARTVAVNFGIENKSWLKKKRLNWIKETLALKYLLLKKLYWHWNKYVALKKVSLNLEMQTLKKYFILIFFFCVFWCVLQRRPSDFLFTSGFFQ